MDSSFRWSDEGASPSPIGRGVGGEKALLANHWFARLRTPERHAFGPGRGNGVVAVTDECRTVLRSCFAQVKGAKKKMDSSFRWNDGAGRSPTSELPKRYEPGSQLSPG